MSGESEVKAKPLGAKSYGSIPHLPGSRLGPGDHHCTDGQATIVTAKTRDRHDVVIVQEKLDGSCCSVAKLENGEIVALGRAGWPAQTSKYTQHQLFASWVREHEARFSRVLKPGQRVVGEWLAQAHGTIYRLTHEPFVVFDVMEGTERATYAEVQRLATVGRFVTPALLAIGPTTVDDAMAILGTYGFHGATEQVEGVVWRVERQGKVDFLAKFVRHDKVDGCYLKDEAGEQTERWLWRPAS